MRSRPLLYANKKPSSSLLDTVCHIWVASAAMIDSVLSLCGLFQVDNVENRGC